MTKNPKTLQINSFLRQPTIPSRLHPVPSHTHKKTDLSMLSENSSARGEKYPSVTDNSSLNSPNIRKKMKTNACHVRDFSNELSI